MSQTMIFVTFIVFVRVWVTFYSGHSVSNVRQTSYEHVTRSARSMACFCKCGNKSCTRRFRETRKSLEQLNYDQQFKDGPAVR
jgi:hypothetical protein